jgi:hypothetical protein
MESSKVHELAGEREDMAEEDHLASHRGQLRVKTTTATSWKKKFDAPTKGRKSWVRRIESKAKELQGQFGLEGGEELLDSFMCAGKNENNVRRFFEKIDRGGLEPAWEPRGDWNENPEKIESICKDLGLIHIVDLMRREPLSDHPTAYTRLHGLNRKEYDYRYDYSDSELEQLAEKLTGLAQRHKTVYCMFNNDNMFANAQTLMQRVQG